MLNNKGLAITTALYSLLVAFLLFLGITLSTFASSANQLGSANSDLIDGKRLTGSQIKLQGNIGSKWYLYQTNNSGSEKVNNTLAVVNSRYGVAYWPKDSDANAKYTSTYNLKSSGEFLNNTKLKWYFFKENGSDYEPTETIEDGENYILLICDEGLGSCNSVVLSGLYNSGAFNSNNMTIIKLGETS